MSEGREREKWQHTSWLLSTMANVMGGNTSRPSDFDPFHDGKSKKLLDRQQARDLIGQLIEQSNQKKAEAEARDKV